MNKKENSKQIDIVYTWVDDKDKNWQKQKKLYQTQYEFFEDATTNNRFVDDGLLKYSLRSVQKYAPWINHIYIVTAEQIPKWLNINNPKISVVFHRNIMPSDALPPFNSNAIEMCLDNIQGLSEYFLYSNDDTFFGDFVDPSFFFKKEKVICRFFNEIKLLEPCIYKDMLQNSVKCFENAGFEIPKRTLHHNIDAYKKSLILECKNKFKNEIDKTIHNQFRTNNDLQRIIFSFYMVAIKQGYMKRVYNINKPLYKKLIKTLFCGSPNDSMYFNYKNQNIEYSLKEYKPKLFCLNEFMNSTKE